MPLCKFETMCTWLFASSGIANITCGLIAAIMFLIDVKVVETFLCVYLAMFGCLQLASQKKDERGRLWWEFLRKQFSFLGSDFGLGMFLGFVGTLGLSFVADISDGIRYVLPFIAGCFTTAMALFSFARMCMCGRGSGYNEIA